MIAAAIALAALAPTGPSNAEDGARVLLDRVAEVYGGLDAYTDQGERTIVIVLDGERSERVDPFRLAFARPDRLAIEVADARLVSDGDRLLTVVTPAGHFESEDAPSVVGVDTLAVSAVGSSIMGDPLGPPSALILGLLTGEEPGRSVVEVALEDDRERGGALVRVLRVATIGSPDWRLLIDPERSLIVAAEAVIPDDRLESIAPPGLAIESIAVTWDAGPIGLGPPDPSVFDASDPPGMADVGRLLDPEARPNAIADDPRIGAPAPQFAFDLLGEGGEGDPESVRSLDFEGKVLLLDVWATWCGPCLRELPEVSALLDAYIERGDSADDLRVVFLSIDRPTGEAAEHAETLRAFLVEHDLDLRRPPLAAVGLDPDGKVARAFGVKAIPSAILIGRDGNVRAAFTGFEPDLRRRLTEAIDDALEAPLEPTPSNP